MMHSNQSSSQTCVQPDGMTQGGKLQSKSKAKPVTEAVLLPVGKLPPRTTSIPMAVPFPMPSQVAGGDQGVAARVRQPMTQNATTAIIRNVPARCSQARLLKMWPPEGSYNLLYLPYCFKSRRGAGFALVNFTSHAAMLDFRETWHGSVLLPEASAKPLDVVMAEVQGLESNLMQMRASNKMNRIKHMKHVPVLIHPDGSFADFKVVMQLISSHRGGVVEELDNQDEGVE